MKVRSLILSDLHIGNPNSQIDLILKVLKEYEFEFLFLNGDIIDMTYLERYFRWKQNYTKVIQKILKLSKKTKVIYLPGNHDFYIREFIEDHEINLGNITIINEYVHVTVSGEKILFLHGDQFDGIVNTNKILYWLGDHAYELSIKINNIYNIIRKKLGLEYWSLSLYLKRNVKNIVKFLAEYKKIAVHKIKTDGVDSLAQGHTHSPDITDIDGYRIYNSGDFIDSNSYLIETLSGEIKLMFVNKY